MATCILVLSFLLNEQTPFPPEIAVSASPGTVSFLDDLFEDNPFLTNDDKLNRILENQTVTLKLVSNLFREERELKENGVCNCEMRRSKFVLRPTGVVAWD